MSANGKSCEFALLFEVDSQLISHAAAIYVMQQQSEIVLCYSARRFGVSVNAAGIRKESDERRRRSNNGEVIQHNPT
jgi:ribosome-binding protein aMBF1 (putative translation factor)